MKRLTWNQNSQHQTAAIVAPMNGVINGTGASDS